MTIIEWFRKHFQNDDQRDDWYAWLTNQTSHVALGILVALVVSVAFFLVAGEFPEKEIIWLIIVLGFLALEAVRGWVCWDSAEDVIFSGFYGTGGALLVFSEVTPGSPYLLVSVSDVLPVLGVSSFHLFCGVYLRWPR
ncbi:MAG: hypothetical protein QM523_01095 [Candidatus Pacebacteria bacterium]|nr:hypothetical protein [Candidatus Paceibacterota bacterium]